MKHFTRFRRLSAHVFLALVLSFSACQTDSSNENDSETADADAEGQVSNQKISEFDGNLSFEAPGTWEPSGLKTFTKANDGFDGKSRRYWREGDDEVTLTLMNRAGAQKPDSYEASIEHYKQLAETDPKFPGELQEVKVITVEGRELMRKTIVRTAEDGRKVYMRVWESHSDNGYFGITCAMLFEVAADEDALLETLESSVRIL